MQRQPLRSILVALAAFAGLASAATAAPMGAIVTAPGISTGIALPAGPSPLPPPVTIAPCCAALPPAMILPPSVTAPAIPGSSVPGLAAGAVVVGINPVIPREGLPASLPADLR